MVVIVFLPPSVAPVGLKWVSIYMLSPQVKKNLKLASRNLPTIEIMNSISVTSYDVLRRRYDDFFFFVTITRLSWTRC